MTALSDKLGLTQSDRSLPYQEGVITRRNTPFARQSNPYNKLTQSVSHGEWNTGWTDENDKRLSEGELTECQSR